ncbi:nucleoside-diphosphate-sugar epimerase family protein [Aspergillus cavernicola]|uniref:Nucleoside-diphosphate-sugar epimerase family protein n=1 Tax=Aspergillus cavernicola TaxID=176166 RepID=A0ABR4ICM1_9EURO
MSALRKTILVTGSTGKQGGALIQSLLSDPDTAGFNIIAVTRDITSPRALKLGANFNVSVVHGDMAQPEAIFQKVSPVWGVYSVQVNSDTEEQQGMAIVDAAVAHGVRHFVYSSGDRGGPEKSPVNPTKVKNFAAKYHVENHLIERAAASPQKMTYTILRPVTFFENLTTDIHGKGFARMWEQMGDKKLQFVSIRDIGRIAAESFIHPHDYYRDAALTLVGDELTQPEAEAMFKAAVGFSMPLAPCPVASTVKFFLKGTVGDMFRWFEREGYGGDVVACRQLYPGIKDFKSWIEENKGQWLST